MASALDRIGDPDEFTLEGAHDLHVHAGRLVLARVQARVGRPMTSREARSRRRCTAVRARSSSATGTKRASARASSGVTVEIARLTVDCDTP